MLLTESVENKLIKLDQNVKINTEVTEPPNMIEEGAGEKFVDKDKSKNSSRSSDSIVRPSAVIVE